MDFFESSHNGSRVPLETWLWKISQNYLVMSWCRSSTTQPLHVNALTESSMTLVNAQIYQEKAIQIAKNS